MGALLFYGTLSNNTKHITGSAPAGQPSQMELERAVPPLPVPLPLVGSLASLLLTLLLDLLLPPMSLLLWPLLFEGALYYIGAAGYLSGRDVASQTRREATRSSCLCSCRTASRATGYVSVIYGSNRTRSLAE